MFSIKRLSLHCWYYHFNYALNAFQIGNMELKQFHFRFQWQKSVASIEKFVVKRLMCAVNIFISTTRKNGNRELATDELNKNLENDQPQIEY